MYANTSPFELLDRATAALHQRSELGAPTAARGAQQLRALQATLFESVVELTAWDPKFAAAFAPIQRMVNSQIDALELSARGASGCRCSHATSAHDPSGCLEESWNGPMGYCACAWPGDVPAATVRISDRAEVERLIEQARTGR